MNTVGQKYLRGQVWMVRPSRLYEGNSVQRGTRPMLIVSNNIGNARAPILNMVPITSQDKSNHPGHVIYVYEDLTQTILCEQIRTIGHEELLEYKYTLSPEIMAQVDEALCVVLDLQIRYPSFDQLEFIIEQIARAKAESVKSDFNKVTDDKVLHIAESLGTLFDDILNPPKQVAPTSTTTETKVELHTTPAEDQVPSTPDKSSKVSKHPRGFWTADRMKAFIEDRKSLSLDQMRIKWDLPDNKTVSTYISQFKKRLAKLDNKDSNK